MDTIGDIRWFVAYPPSLMQTFKSTGLDVVPRVCLIGKTIDVQELLVHLPISVYPIPHDSK